MAEVEAMFQEEKREYTPFNKEEWAKKKAEERLTAFGMAKTAMQKLSAPEKLVSYLDVQATFDRYSPTNCLLIAAQKKDATALADFDTWKDKNVFIKKGESAIIILEPGKEYKRKDGTVATSFETKRVFDISQTTALVKKPEPGITDDKKIARKMIPASPVEVAISDKITADIGAVYYPESKRICVLNGMDGKVTCRCLAREIAKARLNAISSKLAGNPTAVYSASYIICKRAGISPEEWNKNIEPFANMEEKDKKELLTAVRRVANDVTGLMFPERNSKSKTQAR